MVVQTPQGSVVTTAPVLAPGPPIVVQVTICCSLVPNAPPCTMLTQSCAGSGKRPRAERASAPARAYRHPRKQPCAVLLLTCCTPQAQPGLTGQAPVPAPAAVPVASPPVAPPQSVTPPAVAPAPAVPAPVVPTPSPAPAQAPAVTPAKAPVPAPAVVRPTSCWLASSDPVPCLALSRQARESKNACLPAAKLQQVLNLTGW